MQSRTFWILAWTIVACGFVMRAPVLFTGFIVDDYAQLSMMQGTYPVPRSPLALFTFTNGTKSENERLVDSGFFPWWTDSELRISLFRPLSSALMWLDLRLFRDEPFGYHLHSALWWFAMMIAWAAVLKRLLPAGLALLALLACALHPAHGVMLGWIANRNATVATALCMVGLLAQLRNRQDSGQRVPAIAVASYALALSASEYALGFLPFAFALAIDDGASSWRDRALRVAPLAALMISYGVLRSTLGFGARGSNMYIDPTVEPLAFLSAARERLPVLAGELVLGLQSNWWSTGYPWAADIVEAFKLPASWLEDLRPLRRIHVGIGMFALAGAAWIAWLERRYASTQRNRTAPLVPLGLPFALLPSLGSLPESRLLLPALFGWTIVLARFGAHHVSRARDPSTRVRVGAVLGVTLATLLWGTESFASFRYSRQEALLLPQVANAVRTSILAPDVDRVLRDARRALLIAAVDPTTTIYIPLVRRWHGHAGPEVCHLLWNAFSEMRLERVEDRVFVLERLRRTFTASDVYASVFNRALPVIGNSYRAKGMRVTVETVEGDMPRRIRYELDTSLDDPSVILLIQTTTGLQPVPFPPPGQSRLIPPPAFPIQMSQR